MNNSLSTRPRLATYTLDLNVICDICKNPRTVGRHTKCSRIRQQRMNAYWQSVMDNQAAKRKLGPNVNLRGDAK